MTVLSFSAYALWIFLAASFFHGNTRGFYREKTAVTRTACRGNPVRGVFLALASGCVFFLLPPGSLPPFCNASFGGVLVLACFFFGVLPAKQYRVLPAYGAVGVTVLVFFCYARLRGMPGSPANLGTFAAMPVWGIASLPEFCGFVVLAVGFFAAASRIVLDGETCPPVAVTLQTLALGALFVVLFVPWNAAPHVSWPDAIAAGCDFILFWLKVFCTCACFSFRPLPGRWLPFSCCAVGGFLVLAFPE